MNILALVLTTRDAPLARLSAESIRVASRYSRNSCTIGIVVNSQKDGYFENVRQCFKNDASTLLFETVSTGMPGPGHNAVLEIFRSMSEYDYLLMVDGDDLVYPSALYQIEQALAIAPTLDVLGIQTNDSIRREILPNEISLPLVSGARLYGWFENWPNAFDPSIWHIYPNPFQASLAECYTPARLILFSRRAVEMRLHPAFRYTDECQVDDLVPFLSAALNAERNLLDVRFTSNSFIYLCNRLGTMTSSSSDKPDFAREADRTFHEELIKLGISANLWDRIPNQKNIVLSVPPFFGQIEKLHFANRYLDMRYEAATCLARTANPFAQEIE